jgi:hypothetical protein
MAPFRASSAVMELQRQLRMFKVCVHSRLRCVLLAATAMLWVTTVPPVCGGSQWGPLQTQVCLLTPHQRE